MDHHELQGVSERERRGVRQGSREADCCEILPRMNGCLY